MKPIKVTDSTSVYAGMGGVAVYYIIPGSPPRGQRGVQLFFSPEASRALRKALKQAERSLKS